LDAAKLEETVDAANKTMA
jgi:dynein heavy chain